MPPSDEGLHNIHAWMHVTLERVHVGVIVAFSELAHRHAMHRHGMHTIVLTWDEFKAWAAGVDEVSNPLERHERLAQGLFFFGNRQGLAVQFFR